MTEAIPGTQIRLAGVPNVRDLGGWQTADGSRVSLLKVFRSTELHHLADGARAAFDRLGIKTVYDLRTSAERSASPDPQLEGVTAIYLDVLADSVTGTSANLTAIEQKSALPMVAETLGEGRAEQLMTDTYRKIVTSSSALVAYRALFEGLAGDHRGPALFHCTTGKDRTGWAAAALLSILGVDRSDIYVDYLLTNEQLTPALRPIFEQFTAAGGDPELLRPVLGVEQHYLETAFLEMEQTFGDIEGYFRDGLRVDDTVPTALRARLLQST
jgi:protein-tyrosine phosphatase